MADKQQIKMVKKKTVNKNGNSWSNVMISSVWCNNSFTLHLTKTWQSRLDFRNYEQFI